jgi:YggT family protein
MGAVVLLNVVRFVLIGLEVVILARVLLSFVDPAGRSRFAPFILSTTEPLLAPIRKVLPRTGMVDFSPFVAILIIGLILRAVG